MKHDPQFGPLLMLGLGGILFFILNAKTINNLF
jgi:acyl-CoA synthetase (NDP forming)